MKQLKHYEHVIATTPNKLLQQHGTTTENKRLSIETWGTMKLQHGRDSY
jgi:hypothetical protein